MIKGLKKLSEANQYIKITNSNSLVSSVYLSLIVFTPLVNTTLCLLIGVINGLYWLVNQFCNFCLPETL